jgi:Holliday junction DNA helicase RuvA
VIAELRGEVIDRREDSLVVLVEGTGIGLEVMVPDRVLAESQAEVHLFTSLHVASDGPLLAGFGTPEELRVFKALLNVNGVGPRMAVRVLSTHPASRIYDALDQEDPKPFQAVSGIGARTANRIILELRGKLVPEDKAPAEASDNEGAREVLEALLGLGYTRTEATIALNQTMGESMSVEDRLAAALRDLGARGRPA